MNGVFPSLLYRLLDVRTVRYALVTPICVCYFRLVYKISSQHLMNEFLVIIHLIMMFIYCAE